VATEEAQQAQDVILGMFFASSHPATGLFDLGASHSFISFVFVAKYHLCMSIMKHTMLVSSQGGEMRTEHVCLAVSITIRGVDFLTHLIILESTRSHPAIVLFDLGASHSFISSVFVAKYHMCLSITKHTMLVSSQVGEMRTEHVCLAVSITIRVVDFLTHLIILDSKGIDIILGMDWLRKYDGVIMCAKRAVRLTTEHGTIVEFSTVITTNQTSMLNQVHGNSLEEIRVVQEYQDVFPKELPGMPPDRDIEFIIDLLPETPPISKRPYRMPVNELVELKK
jgi:hypothetical protein